MKRVIVPGSFDPITNGHIHIIERAAKLFDEVYVVVLCNPNKKGFFSVEERITLMNQTLSHLDNVKCDAYSGLTIDYARKVEACAMIRGVRTLKDYEYEKDLAAMNALIAPEIESVILFADGKYALISSSMVKELAHFHADYQDYVPNVVYEAMQKKRSDS
ncbi:MAG: pantetheine-phosphate adenylyltransferase [Longicatena sp.]|nr:pantetheine-phosphate adenylyltransferase [Longicatena sp.]